MYHPLFCDTVHRQLTTASLKKGLMKKEVPIQHAQQPTIVLLTVVVIFFFSFYSLILLKDTFVCH